MLEILYQTKYDYTMDSFGRNLNRTQIVKASSVLWDGVSDMLELVRAHEAEFLNADHPTTSPHSWNHRDHRIEVAGLRCGGKGGFVFVPIGRRISIVPAGKGEAVTA
jgi:hypothetical protein